MLINLRNALMAGKRLPYDAEVEYLESTGTQWIDTGINAKQSLRIRAVFETNSTTSQFAYGVRAGNSTISCSTGVGTSVGLARWGTSAYADAGPSGLVDITQDSSGVIVNGTSHRYNATQTVVEQSGYTMVVFAGRNSDTTVTANMVGKFYSCKIWENGILVRDYIPVRKGSVGYLYDRVTRKLFGNAGTGDFVLGPDVVPVEYIESHGTEWIDTGVYLTGNHSVEIDFQLTAVRQSRKGLFGGLSTSRYGALLSPSNRKLEFGYGSGNIFYQITPDALRHSAKQQKNLLYLDGVLINTFNEATFTSNFSAPLGNFSYANYAPAQAKYYLSKWYDGDTLIRSFRSIRVGTDATSWEGAMMDVLTRRIYRNAGTGAFTYGNDLKYPIPAE